MSGVLGDPDSAEVQKILMERFGKNWETQTEDSLFLSKELGNTYTCSLYMCLLSLIVNPNINLMGKRILMFSYGSGNAASMFTVRVRGDYSQMQVLSQVEDRLQS